MDRNVNRFRGFLVPRLDWIRFILIRNTRTSSSINETSEIFNKFQNLKKFKIFITFKNFQEVSKISVFIKFHKISKFSKNFKILF